MKKILFLGRIAGVYNTNRKDLDFIADELVKNGFCVEIYDPKKNILKNLNDGTIRSVKILPNISKPRIFQRIFSFANLIFFCLKFRKTYNYVQINYLREEYLLIPSLVSKLGSEFKIFIYGDDINIRTKLKDKFTSIFKYADEIILTNKLIFDRNRRYFKNPEVIEKKLKIIYLPQIQLKHYEAFRFNDKELAKIKMGISDKRVLTCGISSHPNEQHDKIIEGLSKLSDKQKYHILIPLSSREFDNSLWIEKIKELAKSKLSDIDFEFIEGYKTIEEVATYRLASDVLINLRKRDQLNAAMIESNYSYCQVISGSWLPYEDYWSLFNTEKVEDHVNLAEKIKSVFQDENLEKKLKHNRKQAENHYSYRVVSQWLALYKD